MEKTAYEMRISDGSSDVCSSDLDLLKGCIFFNDKMATMPSTAELMKNKYCRGDNSACARFKVFEKLGRESVPTSLFPNDDKELITILETGRASYREKVIK